MKVRLVTLCGCSRELDIGPFASRDYISMPLVPRVPIHRVEDAPCKPIKTRTFRLNGRKDGMPEYTEIEQ